MKIKSLWIPFALFLLVAVPLRVYQVVYLIDPATGFFESGESLYQIFLGILALFVLIIMIMTASCKNTSEFQFRRNIFSGVFALAAAAAMAADSGANLLIYVVDHGTLRYLIFIYLRRFRDDRFFWLPLCPILPAEIPSASACTGLAASFVGVRQSGGADLY